MTPDEYLFAILARERVDASPTSPILAAAKKALMPVLVPWGGRYLRSVEPSGSFAKGTANRSGTDIDLFLSVSPEHPEPLKVLYESLYGALSWAGYEARRQDVSIGLRVDGTDIDLVPGKQQTVLTTDHSLYRRKADTWTKTNVLSHISHVRNGGRQAETRVMKLWRNQARLQFPSFYLELAVIEALRGSLALSLSLRVGEVYRYLAGPFASARFVDPANTNNVISNDLTVVEKNAIRSAASRALQTPWGDLVR